MATPKKKSSDSANSAASEEDQNQTTAKSSAAKGRKKPASGSAARGKKKSAAKSAASGEDFDNDYQPVVYGEPAAAGASVSGSANSQPAATPITSGYSSAMIPAAAGASSAIDAASLHKQPMSAPIASSGSMPSKPVAGSVSSPANQPIGEILRDIKPRENGKDAAFLAPEKFGFDLKKNAVGAQASRGRWVNVLIYSLSTLIILLTILLFVLTFYSGKIVSNQSANLAGQQPASGSASATSSTSTAATTAPAAGSTAATAPSANSYQFTISNLPTDLQTELVSLVQAQFKDNSVTVSNNNSNLQLPTVTNDTIFVKQTNQPQTTLLLNLLAQYGLKPQIQQLASLPVDASLYFVTILPSPNLSGLTSTVYNATGTSGLAKKYCGILTGYKVSSCQALNASATQTGMTVQYKNPEALFVLRRTNEFAGATYAAAASSQVEDIRVTVGK